MYGHIYTPEERKFFLSYIPGHTYKEIQAAFQSRFGWDITISQVKGYMANHKINSGTKGHFPKGNEPANKGKKGVWAPGCEKSWFKPGTIPPNHKPVGTESVRRNYKKDEKYVYVKVEEPNQWKMKHVVVWEEYNGPVPDGKIIIFLDGDTLNTNIKNLKMIDRKTNAIMNKRGLRPKCGNRELVDTAENVAALISAMAARRKKNG